MPTNQSSEEYLDTQIRKLPFHKLRNLDRYLETGDRDWKALISVMPEERYDQSQVPHLFSVANHRELLLSLKLMGFLVFKFKYPHQPDYSKN